MKLILALFACAALMGSASAAIVSQWSFDGNLNDTAAGGGTADNLTDNAGGVTYVPGVPGLGGQAVAIADTVNGANKLTAANSADLQLSSSWTLEAFIWRDTNNNPAEEWERFWTKWGEGSEDYHWAIRGASGMTTPDGLDLFVNGGNNVLNHNSTTATIAFETWTHVALVGDQGANTITAWVDGTQVGSTPYVATNAGGGNMNFGNFAAGNQAPFQFSGYIDDALIHDVAVTPSYLQSRAALLVPEPSSLSLLGLVSVLFLRRRR